MCATVTVMVGGHYIDLVIRPAPSSHIEPYATNEIVDVRRYFRYDDTSPNPDKLAEQINKVKEAVEEIREKAVRLPAPATLAPRQMFVQCQKGRSRSARCVGAFLMSYYGCDMDRALVILRAAYNQRTGDCWQTLNESAVSSWLQSYVK